MKKFVIPLIGLVLASSCTDEFGVDNLAQDDELMTKTVLPKTRSAEDAIAIAIDAASVTSSPSSRSNQVVVDDVISIISASTSRAGIDTLMYAVNYADNSGYALISANPNSDAVLAVTESGHFTSEENFENPGMKIFMDQAKNYVAGTIEPILPDQPVNPQMLDWVYDEINDSVAPRLIVKYGINPEYPRVACGAVAAAQALSYYEKPDSIYLTGKNGNRWLNINWYCFKHLQEPICAYETPNLHPFMDELAIRMNADPKTGNTCFNNCHSVLKSFLPNRISKIYSGNSNPCADIKSRGIIVACGVAKDASGNLENGGHTWIIDGYIFKRIIDMQYIVTYDRFTGKEISRVLDYDRSRTLSYLMHINWGWGGTDNGYFNHMVYQPNCGIPDEGCSVGTSSADEKYYGYNNYYFILR